MDNRIPVDLGMISIAGFAYDIPDARPLLLLDGQEVSTRQAQGLIFKRYWRFDGNNLTRREAKWWDHAEVVLSDGSTYRAIPGLSNQRVMQGTIFYHSFNTIPQEVEGYLFESPLNYDQAPFRSIVEAILAPPLDIND